MPKQMGPMIFVFGSNLAGRHGAGSAKEALTKWGAAWGVGVGRSGQSYAIPTKDENLRTLQLREIRPHVEQFIAYAEAHAELKFQVVAIGCGLAGYYPWQIAPMFRNASNNCQLPAEFMRELGRPDAT